MMRSSILGASAMLHVLIQHLPLQSLFWMKIWRAFRASDASKGEITIGARKSTMVNRKKGVLDVEGARSKTRLAEDEASVLLDRRNTSNLVDL